MVDRILSETFIDAVNPLTAGGLLGRRHLLPGSLVAFGSEHIHDVVNVGWRPALTIHVYSPRLRSMTFYEQGPGSAISAARTEHSEPGALLV